ncbi:unnamed protein product, partial [Closterium sp. NIES-54]
VAASSQVFAAASKSSPESAPYSCRPLSRETLLWHHCLGHPSLPRLRGMASRALVSGLPRSLPPLPPGPAPTCVPCVEGRQRAAPHSSTFPPTEAPLQALHMDIRVARCQLSEHFGSDLPVLRLHSNRGGEFSSDLLRAFCRAEGIRQTFTLPASPQQNGIAERRIGMVMDVARTSMIHAAAPHFLWWFAVQYGAQQLNLQPRVSLPEITPTLRWTGKVGDASVFRVWGSRAFVRDTSADKLSSRAVPCVFLSFPPDAPGWQFYHPTSRRVLSSQDITFDESVSYYRLFPYRTASLPPPPLFLAPGAPPPVEVAIDSGAARGAEPTGAGIGGAEPGVSVSEGAEPGGTESEHVEPGGAQPGGAKSGGAEPERAASGGPPGVPSRREPLSPQQLREWYARRSRGATGAGGAAGAAGGTAGAGAAGGAAGAPRGASGAGVAGGAAGGTGAVGGPAGVGAAGGSGAAGPGGARTGGTGAAGAGGAAGVGAAGAGAVATRGASRAGVAGGTGAGGAAGVVAGDPGAEGTGAVSTLSGGTARPRPYYVPLLQQVLGLPPSPGPTPPFLSPPPVQSQSQLQPTSPLPGPSPYSGPSRGLTERREPESRPRPSTAPLHVPLPSPPASSLPDGPDPESDSLRAASPTVTRFLATAVTNPLFESTNLSALVAELVDFAAACRLDFATSLLAESASASVCPPSVGGECALGIDVLEDRQEEFECFAAALPHLVSMLLVPEGYPDAPDIPTPRSYAEAIEGPYSSQWQAAMDAEMASWKSTGTYLDEVPPPGANIVSDDLVFATADTEALAHVKSELQKRHTCTDLGELTSYLGLRITRDRAQRTITLTQSHMVQQVLQRFGFKYSSPQSTQLPTGHSLSAPPSDESVEPSGPYPELVGCLMYLMTCTRPDLAYPLSLLARYVAPGRHRKVHWDAAKRVLRYLCSTSGIGLVLGGRARVVLTGHADASWVDDLAPQRSSQGYTFSSVSWRLGSVSWRSTRSSFVLSSSCEAEIYVGAMAAQELRWLTSLLTDLGEAPRSPPVLSVVSFVLLTWPLTPTLLIFSPVEAPGGGTSSR